MNKIIFALKWFYMLLKRLLKKPSFLIILLVAALIVPAAKTAMEKEKGILTIGLNFDKNDEHAVQIADKLKSEDSVIRYLTVDTTEEGKKLLSQCKIDALWSFKTPFDEKVDKYVTDKKAFVQVYEREESVALQLSREKLYGAVYPYISYSLYKNYVYNNLADGKDVNETQIKNCYDAYETGDQLIQICELYEHEKSTADDNYLLTPLRGMLSLVIMMCSLAAAMYFLQDENKGRYAWLAPSKKIIPAFGNCFAASTVSAIVVLAAIILANINISIFKEVYLMLLYAVSAALFCVILCMIFRYPLHLGVIITPLMMAMLILCPIFLNTKVLHFIRILLPPYYYLMSIYNAKYELYMILYCIAALSVAQVLNLTLKRNN